MTFQKKEILVVVKTYPNLSRKYDRTVCTAGIDLETNEWIRIFPIRFFDLAYEKRPAKYDIIEIEVEPKNDKFMRKESHKAKDETIRKLGHIGTENNWRNRNKIIKPLLNKSVEELKELYKKDNTSLGIIKPKRIIDFKVTPIDRCRNWERDLILGTQKTLSNEYNSPLDKIPYKFSYVFECNDSNCKKPHSLMIEDWELCQMFRNIKTNNNEETAIEKVKEKYLEYLPNKTNLHLIIGTENRWNKWLVIGVYYPRKKRTVIKQYIRPRIEFD